MKDNIFLFKILLSVKHLIKIYCACFMIIYAITQCGSICLRIWMQKVPEEALLDVIQVLIGFLQKCYILCENQAVKNSVISYIWSTLGVLSWLDLYEYLFVFAKNMHNMKCCYLFNHIWGFVIYYSLFQGMSFFGLTHFTTFPTYNFSIRRNCCLFLGLSDS